MTKLLGRMRRASGVLFWSCYDFINYLSPLSLAIEDADVNQDGLFSLLPRIQGFENPLRSLRLGGWVWHK